MMKTSGKISPKEALNRLAELCVRGEQCVFDLNQKLYRWGISTADSRIIIDSLRENKFVDDARFAACYVNDKYRFAGWGRMKIIRGLAAKHIAREAITTALEGIDSEEYIGIARQALKARRRLLPDILTYEDRMKLIRFGVNRGYEVSMVSDIVKRID